MNLDQIREKIVNSERSEWINSISISVDYKLSKENLKFNSVIIFYEYITKQIEGWNNIQNPPVQISRHSLRYFQAVKDQLIAFFNQIEENHIDHLKKYWERNVVPAVINLLQGMPFDSPISKFLIDVHHISPDAFTGAYDYFSGNNISNQKENFRGAILAHEFLNESSKILDRRIEEEYNKIDELKSKLIEHLSSSEQFYQNKIIANNLLVKTTIEEFLGYKKTKEKEINDWQTHADSTFHEFHDQSKTKIKELERTYEEQLRLKKPAEYWKERATKLRKEGDNFRTYLFSLILFGAICVYILLWKTPEGMLENIFSGDKSSAIRWSIIFIVFMSLIFLGIKYIAKAMFSSYHLARDAEEREQLMFVYLAMIKDSAVDEKDKHLIMQSLFSRADTGLLKEDSSPTMPGILDKTIKN